MASNWFSGQGHPQRNANADTNLKRRSCYRNRMDSFYGYPQQKRARTQTQFQSAIPNKVHLHHGGSIPRVSNSYDSYVHGFGSNLSNNLTPNRLSPVLRNNDVSVSVSSQPMTNSNYQNLPGFGTCNSERASVLLPRRKQNDIWFDSLPEWNPNEPTSQIRNGFVPNVLLDNFPIQSPNLIPHGFSDSFRQIGNQNQGYSSMNTAPLAFRQRDYNTYHLQSYPVETTAKLPHSMPTGHESTVTLLPQVMPNSKQTLVSNDLSDLLRKLKNGGVVSVNDMWKQNGEISKNRDKSTLGTEFDVSLLRVRHESVINALYSDLPRQCASCGLRFRCQEEHRDHMDWHVRKNRMAKDTNKNTRQTQKPKKSCKWFASAGLWLSAGTTEPLDEEAAAELFNRADKTETNKDEDFVVPADDNQKTCALCKEPFEDFFSDEADEWMYKGAVYLNMHKQTETRTGMNRSMLGPIVHAKCTPENRKAATEDPRQHKSIPVPIPSASALVC